MSNPVSAGQWSVSRDSPGEARREWVNDAIDIAVMAVLILLLVLIATV
jgi:hypothetical protein